MYAPFMSNDIFRTLFTYRYKRPNTSHEMELGKSSPPKSKMANMLMDHLYMKSNLVSVALAITVNLTLIGVF